MKPKPGRLTAINGQWFLDGESAYLPKPGELAPTFNMPPIPVPKAWDQATITRHSKGQQFRLLKTDEMDLDQLVEALNSQRGPLWVAASYPKQNAVLLQDLRVTTARVLKSVGANQKKEKRSGSKQ